MTHEELVGLIKVVPEQVAEFLKGQEQALLDFVSAKGKVDRIAYLEKQIARVPELQAELDALTKP